ncbi:MAG TPA: multicopper oxidase domain-containing protein [Candidatus Cybelea sp.]|nr:multicopper oxidase domain-containing protein [Candidatus Cybelea sp.]
MSRRLLIFVIVAALAAGCRGASGPTGAIPPGPGTLSQLPGARLSPDTNVNELPEPPVVKAVDGVAKVSLIANVNPATGLPSFQYNGLHGVAPTIEVQPGQRFVINLTDDLPVSGGLASDMNLHFHGMGSAPRKPGDDVLGVLATPGQMLHYEVHVPINQEPGLYWYHPHVHLETSYQVGEGGMSGAIVVLGIEKHLPRLAKMKQRLIVVRATGIGVNARPHDDADAAGDSEDAMPGMAGMAGMPMATARPLNSNRTPCLFYDGLNVTLNGAFEPVITIAPGEKQFFRVVNATGHKTLKLAVDGENIQVVAIDGFALDSYPGTPATESVPYLVVPPAARAEFIVTGPASGHGTFRTLCYNSGPNGDGDPPWLLAKLRAPKHADGGDFSTQPITAGAPQVPNGYNTKLPPPAAKRVVVFSENNKPQFFINGKQFSMYSKPMYVVHVGTVEEWHVVNVTQEIHDFHIHQLHFLVQKINGVPVKHPYWADSVVIPHRYPVGIKSVPGTLDLLMDFRSPIIKGEFLFHCHILDHEDQGMMAKIEAI